MSFLALYWAKTTVKNSFEIYLFKVLATPSSLTDAGIDIG